MPANKYALLRYRIIDRCLTNDARPFPSKEELRQACEEALYGSEGEHISISTIEKDMWSMRYESDLGYYAPIEYDKANRGYFYEDKDYTIQDISLSDEELGAIRLAANTLNQFRDIPIFSDYQHAIDKILNRLTISPHLEGDHTQIIQFESSPSARGQDFLAPLLTAIQNSNMVKLRYQKFSDGQSKVYSLDPYLLKEYRNRWYLIAYEALRGDFITFGLDRITELDVLDTFYAPRNDFNADRFFLHSVGITSHNKAPKTVVIKVGHTQGQYLKSQPLHHSQKLVSESSDSVVFEYFVLITHELVKFILGMGSDVEALQPEELRNSIKSQISMTLAKY